MKYRKNEEGELKITGKSFLLLVTPNNLVVYKTPVPYDTENDVFHIPSFEVKHIINQCFLAARQGTPLRAVLHKEVTHTTIFIEEWEL